MRNDFQYYIFSRNKKPLYVNESGFVVEGTDKYLKANGQPAKLEYSPIRWRDTSVKYARNIKWWGVFRDMAESMDYPEDGAKILRHLMWQEGGGIETEAYLGMLRLDRERLPYNYKAWYFSELNFVKYKDEGATVSMEALEGGPIKYLKAYENTAYEIPITTDPERVAVLMDGMELGNTARYAITTGISLAQNANLGNHLVDAAVVQKEVEDIGGVQDVERTKVRNNNQDLFNTRKYLFKATAPARLKLKWDFRLKVEFTPPPAMNPATELYVMARIVKPDNPGAPSTPATSVELLRRRGSLAVTGDHLVQGEAFIDVVPGDEIYLYTLLTVEGATGDAQTAFTYGGTEPYLEITYTYQHEASRVYGLTPYRLCEKLVERITEGRYGIRSNFLSQLKDIVITSGMGVRGNSDAVIKTHFADFFQWLNFYEVGLGVEGDKIVIEPLSYFFRDETVLDLSDDIASARLDVAEDLLFNTIKLGWSKHEYNGINGIHEFNQGQQWKTPITKITKEADWTSNYRADPYGIELLRINFGQKKSTDSRSDNDTVVLSVEEKANTILNVTVSFSEMLGIIGAPSLNLHKDQVIRITGSQFNDGDYVILDTNFFLFAKFIALDRTLVEEPGAVVSIEILRGKEMKLKRPAYTEITGVPFPETIFNTLLTPKTRLLNNGRYLHSILDLMDTQSVKFTSADRNAELSRTLNGVTIKENADVPIGSLPKKYFTPYYIHIRTKVPLNLVELMRDNPYGRIKFEWKGKVYFAYLMDGGIKAATNEIQEWKLLSAPGNNFKNFN